MKFSVLPAPAWAVLLISAGLIALAACNGGDSAPATPTGTEAAPVASPTPFQGTRGPIEKPGDTAPPVPLVVGAMAAGHEQFDRIVFAFTGNLPGYRVEYVSPPITACGSGLLVEVDGGAFLQIRMFPAAAHDDLGMPTIEVTEPGVGLPTVVALERTCDFEGELTWVAGLREEVDFNVSEFTGPLRVAVDVAHP